MPLPVDTAQHPNLHHALLFIALPELQVGDVVTYHGSISEQHGKEFVVTANTGGRLRIRDRSTQEISMSHVRRASVHPTGDVVELCDDCRHIAEDAYGDGPLCRKVSCQCRKHGSNPDTTPPMSKAAEHLLLAIHRAARTLRDGAERTAKDIDGGTMHVDGNRFLLRGAAGVELEALTMLARKYIRECPELGITRDLLDIALGGQSAADLFAGQVAAN